MGRRVLIFFVLFRRYFDLSLSSSLYHGLFDGTRIDRERLRGQSSVSMAVAGRKCRSVEYNPEI